MGYGVRVAKLMLLFSMILGAVTNGQALAQTKMSGGQLVLVMFCRGVARLPQGAMSASRDETSLSSTAVSDLLRTYGVDRVTRAFPAFNPADTTSVTLDGTAHHHPDLSRIYTLRLPAEADESGFIDRLRHLEGVAYAEPMGVPHFCAAFPNDSLFVSGDQWSVNNFGQNGGTIGEDIKAPAAWELSKGTTSVPIAIIDNGVLDTHPDLNGKVSGDLTWSDTGPSAGHGFLVAGVAAALANNRTGITGVDWNAPLISEDITDDHNSNNTFYVGNALLSAVSRGARVLNNSYTMLYRFGTGPDTSVTLGAAFASIYSQDVVVVAAMGNGNGGAPQLPAAYPQMGIIAVGATDRNDNVYNMSNYGSHIDVTAPGVDITTTSAFPPGYETVSGTSLAAPVVSGIAGLMLSVRPDLDNDDIQGIIRASTDKKPTGGWDQTHGTGRVNARRALEYTSSTRLQRGIGTGAVTYMSDGTFQGRFLGVPGLREDMNYETTRYFVYQPISFGTPFSHIPVVWGRGADNAGTVGAAYYAENTFPYTAYFGQSYCELDPMTPVSLTGCRMQTFTFRVHDGVTPPDGYRWVPVDPTIAPTQVRCAWSALDTTSAAAPNPVQSYFVPQSGSVTTPTEGILATRNFWTCPNNESFLQLRSLSARIKVVARDASGNAIAGIAPGDIYVLFNGGTPVQGFAGQGADSIIANRYLNQFAACPDSKVITADAATDVNGETYITFAGSTPGSPGVATRDSTRKWGHYDEALPVFIQGVRLTGRLTPTDNTPYVLRIRNVDTVGGTTIAPDKGELVNSLDISPVQAHVFNHTYNYWEDFNGDGVENSIDLSTVKAHNLDSCNLPTR